MQISKIILGTVQLGLDYGINNKFGRPSSEEAFKILNGAFDAGIESVDTAEAYGGSQDIIGSYFSQNPKKKFKVLTKFKGSEGGSLKEQLAKTLSKLAIDHVEGYSYHQFSEIDNPTVLQQLKELKAAGLVSKIGVSVYTNDELKIAASYDFIDIIQLPFNLFDNWSLRGKQIQNAKQHGKEIHIRSVFLQGLFYMEPSQLPSKLQDLENPLKTIIGISKKYNVGLNALALQYALSFPDIDRVLIGVESDQQFQANLLAMKENIPADAFNEISKVTIENIALIDPRTWK